MNKLDKLISRCVIGLIDLYQATISPDKSPLFRHWLAGRICTHEPHCSAYAKECFEKYSFFSAFHYTIERVSNCLPRHEKQYDPSSYRVVFFSSSPIGVPFLQQIAHDSRYELVGVVTMPDVPVGRGMHIQQNVIKGEAKKIQKHADAKHLEGSEFIVTPRSLRLDSKKYSKDAQEFQDRVSDLQPDLFVVIAYGHIMPQRVLDLPVFGSINVHGSLLPAYRGASPLQSVFLDGKTETGLTIMKMDAGVDTGPMIQKRTVSLPLMRTVVDLIDRIKLTGPKFLCDTLWSWSKGLLTAEPQDELQLTMCRKFVKEDGQIDPLHDDLLQVRQKRQAFALWPKLFFYWEGKRVSIDSFSLHETTTRVILQGATLVSQVGTNFLLHPGVASIRLTPEGKKSLSWETFVHGYTKR